MHFYKIILSYNGFSFHGWQFQSSQNNTVQEVFEYYLKKVLKDPAARAIAASRTDAKVHAQGQVLKIVTITNIIPTTLLERLNFNLPEKIKVKSCNFCEDSFNPNRNAISKEYQYLFSTSKIENPLFSESVVYLKDDLNIDLMQLACKFLTGEHDFKHFYVPGSRTPKTVRNILECTIQESPMLFDSKDNYVFTIRANGFLKYMVRILMHFLIQIGKEDITIEEFKAYFKNEVEIQKAPPHGLHLMEIIY